ELQQNFFAGVGQFGHVESEAIPADFAFEYSRRRIAPRLADFNVLPRRSAAFVFLPFLLQAIATGIGTELPGFRQREYSVPILLRLSLNETVPQTEAALFLENQARHRHGEIGQHLLLV